MKRAHEMPFGATVIPGEGVRFRIWSPALSQLSVVLKNGGVERTLPMIRDASGWFEAQTNDARTGTRYAFALDEGLVVPDPASRFQPEGVHSASEVVDPRAFDWQDADWKGRAWEECVIYELHLGTFSSEGTYAAAMRRLDYLAQLGVTAVELMPLSTAPGVRNWGYDGVYHFAPTWNYGRPEDLKRYVQAAHAKGLMVFLDVVYNHFGPEGNYLYKTAPQFFTDRYQTPWGAAINFDGPGSGIVREFFVHNALYWLEEFNIDGLRLDAVHAIFDRSETHILTELAERVRCATPKGRHFHLILENDKNEARYLARDTQGARSYVAQWNDDIHHAFHVATTGETSGYYEDYSDDPIARLGRALTQGFVYQGEASAHRGGEPRGEVSKDLPPTAFVAFLQNHDQIGNRAFGERLSLLALAEARRAATALLLLAPSPPLLFMGEEWGSCAPFFFFCDFGPELAVAVRDGRRREFAHFPDFTGEAARERIPDPSDPNTFVRSKLDWENSTQDDHHVWLELHTHLLALRWREIVPRLKSGFSERARFVRGPGGDIQAAWKFHDGTCLSLWTNMSAEPVEVAEPTFEQWLLYSTHYRALGDPLPPWYVAFHLAGIISS